MLTARNVRGTLLHDIIIDMALRVTRHAAVFLTCFFVQGRHEGLAKLRLRVEDPPTRKHMVFTGATVLAEIMAGYSDYWISRAEYQEDPARALSKCAGLEAYQF